MSRIIQRQATDPELTESQQWQLWQSEDSTTFSYTYDQSVCFVVQAGGAVINSKTNAPVAIVAGDHVTIMAGVEAVWDISHPIINRFQNM